MPCDKFWEPHSPDSQHSISVHPTIEMEAMILDVVVEGEGKCGEDLPCVWQEGEGWEVWQQSETSQNIAIFAHTFSQQWLMLLSNSGEGLFGFLGLAHCLLHPASSELPELAFPSPPPQISWACNWLITGISKPK